MHCVPFVCTRFAVIEMKHPCSYLLFLRNRTGNIKSVMAVARWKIGVDHVFVGFPGFGGFPFQCFSIGAALHIKASSCGTRSSDNQYRTKTLSTLANFIFQQNLHETHPSSTCPETYLLWISRNRQEMPMQTSCLKLCSMLLPPTLNHL